MTLGEIMLDFRARHRMSQKELAKLAGVSLQTINSVENGTQKPSKLTATKIMLAMKEGE